MVAAPLRALGQPGQGVVPAGHVAAAEQRAGQRQLELAECGLGDLARANRQRLPVQPRGFLECEVLRGRLSCRLAGPRRVQAVTGQRARHPVVRELGQVWAQLVLVEALDRVRRHVVPAPLVRGG